jgi:hypothetical protein
MNLALCETWVRRNRGAAWLADLQQLGGALRRGSRRPGSLFVVGPEDDQPWHLAAHLDMLARYRDVPELQPVAPNVTLSEAKASDAVLVVSESRLDVSLLDRLADVRSKGSAVVGLTAERDPELERLTSEVVAVDLDTIEIAMPGIRADFDLATHLFGVAAVTPGRRTRWRR